MLCSRCKKRMAVVFITRMEGDKTINEGICLQCAVELGIKPVGDMMNQMGIKPEDLENVEQEMTSLMNMMQQQNEDSGDEDFEEGGAHTFPFMQNFLGNALTPQQEGQEGQSGERQQTEDEGREKRKSKKSKYLDSYCINLTARARSGELDRVVGREKEIYRVIQILNRRTKNNPCLIGEPGVGKTAIAEGLAQRIAAGEVPAKLFDREVYLLDLTALVAGTQFRGQFESRIKNLIEEIKNKGNVILVIDEVHNLVGAGDAEGSMSAANILKPALSRGEVQVIGATTFTEYRKYIEKDAALERRFQPVTVEEPSVESAVQMLEGIKQYYEQYHGVVLSDSIVRRAVALSERYITDRYLPDKAIDLIDEAASTANMEDTDANRLGALKRQLCDVMRAQAALEPSDSEEFYAENARLKSEELRLQKEIASLRDVHKLIEVTEEDLARVIELWTGIPASKIKEEELQQLQNLGERLRRRIVGQDEAIDAVCAAIRRNRVGISPKKKPVSFIFTGPTGVGKTELVKTLSAELFDSPETMIRLDMSEFMEKHSVSRIIGSPPGYVGYDDAGQLTEKIRRKPYSVVLFDEIEKAHPDVLNILLQILDDGRITDAHGKTVNFENTIIVMTSNAGSERKEGVVGFNKSDDDRSGEKAMRALEQFLRPEFLNRVDEVIAFHPLTPENCRQIARIMMEDLKGSLSAKAVELRYDDAVLDYIVEKAYSNKYGARNLRRTIEKKIEDRIATIFVENAGRQIDVLVVGVEAGEITVKDF
ncbi:ATP-dependent Clp protease ATP-binding subunit [Clostridiales bacterium BX7]|uniref:ATP-dependent Clp protease ATP-binding subunit n=2 Tax=Feifania hominis TaxID=2763660 RepID=A0A926DCQ7_9FIRM|nr:ATP-dependent Clp protease ATP-binding subunit [Feifania hominis]MBC8535462.1 ATP-dependent Clp protease ATP-binding subunit [Feifania hominis]